MSRLFGRRTGEQEQRDELLSAYLDDQLSAAERARLEARLAADPALQAELDALRRTVALVRDLPPVSVPRNFILPQTVGRGLPVAAHPQPAGGPRPRRAWAAPLLTAATAFSSLLFVLILAGDLLLAGSRMGALAPEPEAALEVEAPQVAMEPSPIAATVAVEAEAERAMPAPTTIPMPTEAPEAEAAEAPEAPVEALAEAPTEAAEALEEEPAAEAVDAASVTAPAAAGGGPIEEPAAPAATASPHKRVEVEAEEGVPSPTALPTATAMPDTLPTPSKAGGAAVPTVLPTPAEAAKAAPPRAGEEADEEPARVSQPVARRAISPWRIAEVILGLLTLGLGLVTVRAWRVRRKRG